MATYPDLVSRDDARGKSVLGSVDAVRAQLGRRLINECVCLLSRGSGQELLECLCECSSPACSGSVRIPASEYEVVRRFPTRFVVRPEHVDHDMERTVEKTDDHAIVEKVGPGAEEAILGDPRNRQRRTRRQRDGR